MRRLPMTLCTLVAVAVLWSPPRAASAPPPDPPLTSPEVTAPAKKPVVAPAKKPLAPTGGVAVTVQVVASIPQVFSYSLAQNYPNAFSSSTTIRYSLAKASRISLVVFSVTGQKVVTLLNWFQNPGVYTVTWDGRGNNGRHVAPGVYFYRMTTPAFSETRKLIVSG